MFYVFKKDKILAFIISVATVFTLVFIGSLYEKGNLNIVPTATKVSKELPIYCVDTEEKKVALTINCAWNDDDIDLILETLDKQEVKVTFFMVGDWIEKYGESAKKIYESGHEIGNHIPKTLMSEKLI